MTFANSLDVDLNFIKDATLDAATEVEEVTKYILERAAESAEFPNAAAVDYFTCKSAYSALPICLCKLPMLQKQKMGDFYQNKLSLALYFVQRILPELALRITKVKAGAEVVMNFSKITSPAKLNRLKD